MTKQKFDEIWNNLRELGWPPRMQINAVRFWELWFEFQRTGTPPEGYTEGELWNLWDKHTRPPTA